MDHPSKIKELTFLVEELKDRSLEERARVLKKYIVNSLPNDAKYDEKREVILLSLAAIGQEKILENIPPHKAEELLSHLEKVDSFYLSIGGLVGYYHKALELLSPLPQAASLARYKRPFGFDIKNGGPLVKKRLLQGLQALPTTGMVFLLGGLGDRLNWRGAKNEPLPAATLPFLGRSLLELLVRDVQALEYLYYKLYHKVVFTPIGLMTSFERENDPHIKRLLKEKKGFGRASQLYFLFSQISVPVITEKGDLAKKNGEELALAPGGHGAFWKTAAEGFFPWLRKWGREDFLVRQINNPIGGLDYGILALLGIGVSERKTLGIASCERVAHAAEGVIVEFEKAEQKLFANIEYTDFARYGIEDHPDERGFSRFPANTNLIYVNLEKIEKVVKRHPLPAMVLNMKSRITHHSNNGRKEELHAGRLESMIQNITEHLLPTPKDPFPTFVTFNHREKTISTAKRSFEPKKPLLETPEGAFYDLLKCNYALLAQECQVTVAPFSTVEEYLKGRISLLFLYHPALGPLFEIIAQKIRGGNFADNSELQLEIAELYLENLQLHGSLLINAESPLGHTMKNAVQYSENAGKCFLKNVTVRNKGRNQKDLSTLAKYWKGEIEREECCQITILGNGEFVAEDVILEGNQEILVPTNYRMVMTPEGTSCIPLEEARGWSYSFVGESFNLLLPEHVFSQDASMSS